MEATTTRRRRDARPRSYYQNLVKDMDESEKLELVSIIIDSLKTTPPMQPYTMDEINAMLDEAEARIDAGSYVTNEDFFREWDEEIARAEQLEEEQQLEMAVAV
jgi:hypothetical protein